MTAHEQNRLQHWRLKFLQEAAATGNVKVCQRYGISRKTFYKSRIQVASATFSNSKNTSKGVR